MGFLKSNIDENNRLLVEELEKEYRQYSEKTRYQVARDIIERNSHGDREQIKSLKAQVMLMGFFYENVSVFLSTASMLIAFSNLLLTMIIQEKCDLFNNWYAILPVSVYIICILIFLIYGLRLMFKEKKFTEWKYNCLLVIDDLLK